MKKTNENENARKKNTQNCDNFKFYENKFENQSKNSLDERIETLYAYINISTIFHLVHSS